MMINEKEARIGGIPELIEEEGKGLKGYWVKGG